MDIKDPIALFIRVGACHHATRQIPATYLKVPTASFSPQDISVLGTLEKFSIFIQFIKNVNLMVLKIPFFSEKEPKVFLGRVTVMFVA